MYYVYVLQSLFDKNLYIGATNDLKKRLLEHNSGLEISTKHRKPFRVVYYECFVNKFDAFNREKYLKTGWGRKHLRHALVNTLK